MKFVRFNLPGKGARLGILQDNDRVIDLTELSGGLYDSFEALMQESYNRNISIKSIGEEIIGKNPPLQTLSYTVLANTPLHSDQPYLLLPLVPPEVWAAGVTYKKSAEARMEESQVKDVYDRVYDAVRPELFLKSTSSRVVGSGDKIGIRTDSKSMVPEPELGIVLGENQEIIGFIIGNDVTSRDIEGENPLYLPQAKIFNNSCSLGPVLTLAEEIPNPYNINIRCEIYRDNALVFSDTANTDQLKRKLEELISFLVKDNPICPGTVLLTGTCIVPPDSFTLMDGDTVNISMDYLGVLSNKVAKQF